ncbi:colanic acid/amylovoran biosynthesis glycosyltransferase [Gramella sp. Hel_I_59]|uniref:glycosyltransferase n=1 Tax=Gramella sp. Hel_I_59 TaxID=1249978 RepID=UPI0011542F71|nr:glycosyltransferase [Gramella sp. Hel_I_59]TQI71947.1 colanic acid/amylovoran biosynthesis glycosyltransferase [Gramella sp. Hel_I_59]
MKIAVFCGKFPSVSETFVVEEICQLLDDGNDVIIFSKEKGGNDFTSAKFNQYKLQERTIYFTLNRRKTLKGVVESVFTNLNNISKIPKLINRIGVRSLFSNRGQSFSFHEHHHFDIIHCHFAVMGDLAVKLRQRKIISGKIITTFHGSGLVTLNSKKGIYPHLIKEGDLFISNSAFTTQVAVSKGYSENKIFYVPAQFDSNKFIRSKPRFYPKEKITIISIGRLVPFKGFYYGVHAIKNLLLKGHTNIEYRIIGEGPTRAELEKEIQEYDLEEYVTLLGQQTSEIVKEELEKADIYIMPGIIDDNGRAEAQGVVLQEAQAMELPVIASRVGGMVQGINDGKSGFLVSQKDEVELAEKIIWFLEHQDRIKEFGQNGRAFVLENFNSKKNFEKLLGCYRHTLNK